MTPNPPKTVFNGLNSHLSQGAEYCCSLITFGTLHAQQERMDHLLRLLLMMGFAALFGAQSRAEAEVAIELHLPPGEGIAALNRIANDTNRLGAERAEAIMKLFKNYVRPGHTPQDIAAFLREPSWLDRAALTKIYAVGGVFPVIPGCGVFKQNPAFRLELFREVGKRASWALEFRMKGAQADGSSPTESQIIDFFKGGDGLCREPALAELALCFPDNESRETEKVLYYGPEGNVSERRVSVSR